METAHYYGSWGRVPRLPWSLQNKLQMKNFKQQNDKVNFSLEKFTPFAGWRQGVRKSFLKAERAVVIVQMKMAYDIVFIQILFFFEMEESHVFQASHVIHTQGWLWTFNPPDFLNGWVTSLPHLRKFDTVLWTKPRTSCILDKHSGSWAIPSVPNPVMSEAWYVKCSTYQVLIEYSRFSNWNRNGKVRIVFPITKIKVEL